MGSHGRRGVLGGAVRRWLRGWALLGCAALAASACSGSNTVTPSHNTGGDLTGGQPDDGGPVPADNGGTTAGRTTTAGRGGSGGSSGGTAGLAGGAGRPGTGGGPSNAAGSRLGRGCVKDSDCQTASEAGLICVSETSNVLGNGAPPHGLCSRPCTDDAECVAHGAGALCYPLGLAGNYCVEGCQFGAPEIGENKCHSRSDFACDPALTASTGDICTTTGEDCQPGELCIDGTCNVVFAACLPACRGDLDCAAGMYCDQSFLAGLCTPKKPTGKRLGEPCTVPGASQPDEPDGCLGFCQADSGSGNQGHCAATCALAHECAWDPASQRFDGVCFYASILTADAGTTGDFGFCTPTCNCSEQCNDPTLACQLLDQLQLDESSFQGAGLCFSADSGTTLEECAAGGTAGAGGMGPGSAGGVGGVGGAQ